MIKGFVSRCIFLLFIALLLVNPARAQLTANAGTGKIICPGVSFTLGATPAATGGTPPYTYSWWPETFLDNTSIENPTCTPTENIDYFLTVTDDSGKVSEASVSISMSYLNNISAGKDTSICFNDSTTIGGEANNASNGILYSWLPTNGLSDSSAPRPLAYPTETTVYNLVASSSGCPAITKEVTITVIPTPNIDAGPDISLTEGEVATLNVTGGYFYQWTPYDKDDTRILKYPTTANPDVEPRDTTDYYILGWDATQQCSYEDTITVNVIPSELVVLYNTFTPNDDNNNDFWYIGNIEKFPDNKLEIYNRYGKLLLKINGYDNLWNGNVFTGRALGERLPSATYFYILDLGNGEKYNGTVTIIE